MVFRDTPQCGEFHNNRLTCNIKNLTHVWISRYNIELFVQLGRYSNPVRVDTRLQSPVRTDYIFTFNLMVRCSTFRFKGLCLPLGSTPSYGIVVEPDHHILSNLGAWLHGCLYQIFFKPLRISFRYPFWYTCLTRGSSN